MDLTTIGMLAILAVLLFFMFRNSRKRQRDAAALREQIVPGAEVMTNFGLYGKLLSINEDDNTALVETSPGNTLKLHRQTISRIVEPTETADADAEPETSAPELNEDHAIPLAAPEYGERVDGASRQPGAKSDD